MIIQATFQIGDFVVELALHADKLIFNSETVILAFCHSNLNIEDFFGISFQNLLLMIMF